MALPRDLRGIESLIRPSQRPPERVKKNIDPSMLEMIRQMIGFGGRKGSPLQTPTLAPAPILPSPSVGIDLPPAPPPTLDDRTPFPVDPRPIPDIPDIPDILPTPTLIDYVEADPPPPRPEGPVVGSPYPGTPGTGTEAQPPSKIQRIQQLMAQMRALENQIRQIKRQIQELQGGGQAFPVSPPKDIGFTPLPQPPWMPPPGG